MKRRMNLNHRYENRAITTLSASLELLWIQRVLVVKKAPPRLTARTSTGTIGGNSRHRLGCARHGDYLWHRMVVRHSFRSADNRKAFRDWGCKIGRASCRERV